MGVSRLFVDGFVDIYVCLLDVIYEIPNGLGAICAQPIHLIAIVILD